MKIAFTHEMNSVIEVGDHIMFLYKGKKRWSGDKQGILNSNNKELNEFVYASKFMKTLKDKLSSWEFFLKQAYFSKISPTSFTNQKLIFK